MTNKSPKYVYHSSNKQHLKEIVPNVSTHGEKWVYATSDIPTAALFIGKNWDFICQIGSTPTGKPTIYEQFEGALEVGYKGHSGSIYKLSGKNFLSGKTSWPSELVSKHPETVLSEIIIDDILKYIEGLELRGEIDVYRHPDKPKNAPLNKDRLVKTAIKWTKETGKDVYIDTIKKYHPEILEKVLEGLND